MAWFLPVFILVLIATCLAIGIALFMLQRTLSPEPSIVELRLKKLRDNEQQSHNSEDAQAEARVDLLLRDSPYKYPKLAKQLEALNWFKTLNTLILQSGKPWQADTLLVNAGFAILTGLLAGILFRMPFLILLGLLVPALYYGALRWFKAKRFKAFVTQLPDALSLICSALRAGHAFHSALGIVASDMKEPIAGVFKQVVSDMNLGISVREALGKMYDNVSVSEAHIFMTAVLIQRESGGNLAELLTKLGHTIRERFKLKRHISSLTAQSRMTGYVVGAAPLVMAIIFSIIFPGYFKPMTESLIGQIALCIGLVLQIIGIWVINKIVNIRV